MSVNLGLDLSSPVIYCDSIQNLRSYFVNKKHLFIATLFATLFASAIAIGFTLFNKGFAAEPNQPMTPAQQKQMEDLVHNYLVKNPEVIVEALQALQQKQMEQARKTMQKTQETAPKFADAIFHESTDPVVGNPNGKVTIVDFFDYQCPHCIKMTPILESVIKSNPDVRIVFKEFPIRGPLSEYAAKVALAANTQGKYFEFHKALMQQMDSQQPLTEAVVLKTAQSVGLDIDKLKVDIKNDAIAKQIKNTMKLGQDLQLLGTPAFFVAKTDVKNNVPASAITFIPGQVDQVQLLEVIKKAEGKEGVNS